MGRCPNDITNLIQQWALHNNIILLAIRVVKPKDKAMVEGAVKLAYQRIYAPVRDKVFFTLEELNAVLHEQLRGHNNRPMHKKDYSRQQLFEQQEQSLLQCLPDEPFILKHSPGAAVQRNCHIVLGEDWHYYSVPHGLFGKRVRAVYDTDIVEVYAAHKRVALHKRSYKRHGNAPVKNICRKHTGITSKAGILINLSNRLPG